MDEPKKTIVFRIAPEQRALLDELAARASAAPGLHGGAKAPRTTSQIVREALRIGLEALEKKYPAKRRRPAAKKIAARRGAR